MSFDGHLLKQLPQNNDAQNVFRNVRSGPHHERAGGDLVDCIAANYTPRTELLSTQRSYISPDLWGTAGNVAWSPPLACPPC